MNLLFGYAFHACLVLDGRFGCWALIVLHHVLDLLLVPPLALAVLHAVAVGHARNVAAALVAGANLVEVGRRLRLANDGGRLRVLVVREVDSTRFHYIW